MDSPYLLYCPSCGAANPDHATQCFACEKPISSLPSDDTSINTASPSQRGQHVSNHLLKQRYRLILGVCPSKRPSTLLLNSVRGHVFTYRSQGNVLTLAWSHDGQEIASGGDDQTAQLWNAVTGATIYTSKGYSAAIETLTWSPHDE